MKKSILVIISCIMLTIFLVSCTETTPTQLSVGKSIDKNLNNLLYTVSKLDTIDNTTIANPDMYPSSALASFNLTPSDNFGFRKSIAKFEPNSTNELTNLLIDKLLNKYKCDNNGNCLFCNHNYGNPNDTTCDNCNCGIICNNNGKCTNCNSNIILNENGQCKNCNQTCVNGNCSSYNATNYNNNCASLYRNPLETKKISLIENNENNNFDGNYGYTSKLDRLENRNNQSFRNPVKRNQREKDLKVKQISNITENEDEITENNSKTETPIHYYYIEESFLPESLKYNPRFVSSYDQTTTENNLNNYIIKVQKLYAITNDVLEANSELTNYKDNLITAIDATKKVNDNFKILQYEPSLYQIQAIKNYLTDLKSTNSILRNCNGNINDQINNITSNNATISTSVDIMNSNYLKLLNQLDMRITYHKNALATLEQLSYVLQDAITNNTQDIQLNNTNGEIPNENDNNVIENNIDNNTIYDDNNEFSNNEENRNLDENETILNNSDPVISDESINSDNNEEKKSLLDTYNDTPLKNIDTYKNDNEIQENDVVDDSNFEDNNNSANNYSNENINSNDANLNETSNNNNDSVNDNTMNNNNTNIGNTLNDGNNNIQNNQTNNYNNGNNQNSLISQNNLNTDGNTTNGSNYYYDENGNLYNANNFNGIDGNRNNNVDTYNYNTLIDTLNRGTIDNGINTLNISATNSEVIDNEETTNNFDNNNSNIEDDETFDDNDENNKNTSMDNYGTIKEDDDYKKSIAKKENNMDINNLVDSSKNIKDPEIEFVSDENIN